MAFERGVSGKRQPSSIQEKTSTPQKTSTVKTRILSPQQQHQLQQQGAYPEKPTVQQPTEPEPVPVIKPLPTQFDIMIQNAQEKQYQSSIQKQEQPIQRNQLAVQTFLRQMDTNKQFYHTKAVLRHRSQNIDSTGQYLLTYDIGDKKIQKVITGAELQSRYAAYQNRNISDIKEYNISSRESIKAITSAPSGTLFYKTEEGYIGATPEAQSQLGFYKSKGYVPPEGDVGFYSKPPRPSDVLFQIKGERSARIIVGSQAMFSYGLPFLTAGVEQAVTGNKAIERQWQEYAYSGLKSLPGRGESTQSALWRQLTSPEIITDVYIPLAFLGIGAAVKPVSSALSGSRIINYLSANKTILGKTVTVGTGLKIGLVGSGVGIAGIQIAMHPEQTSSIVGRMGGQLVLGGAAYKLGTGLKLGYNPASNWDNTYYGEYVKNVSRQEALSSARYYEWAQAGRISNTAIIAPVYQRIPYVPKHPQIMHETARIFGGTTGEPTQSFILKRPTASNRRWGYEIVTPSVEKNVSLSYGKMKTENYTREMSGVGYIKEIPSSGDVNIYKTLSKQFGGETRQGYLIEHTKPLSGATPGRFGLMEGDNGRWINNIKLKVGEKEIFTSIKTKTPVETTYLISKTYGRDIDVFNLGKFYRKMPHSKEYYGSSMGLDTTGITVESKTTEIILPGGISSPSKTEMFSSMQKLGGFSKQFGPRSISLSQIEEMEYGIQSSSRWKGVAPNMGMQRTAIEYQQQTRTQGIMQMPMINVRSLEHQVLNQRRIELSLPKSISMVRQDVRSRQTTRQKTQQASMQQSMQRSLQRTDTSLMSIPGVVPVNPQIFNRPVLPSGGYPRDIIRQDITEIPPPVIPFPGLYGGGLRGGPSDNWWERYFRKRTFNIGLPLLKIRRR